MKVQLSRLESMSNFPSFSTPEIDSFFKGRETGGSPATFREKSGLVTCYNLARCDDGWIGRLDQLMVQNRKPLDDGVMEKQGIF